jgi:hypothetical protein
MSTGEHVETKCNVPTEQQAEECWSLDECEFRYGSLCDLLDCNSGELQAGQVVYVGDQVPADPTIFFDADDLIDRLGEVAYDNHGECAEDWPDNVTKEAKDEFNAFVDAWIAKYCPPRFYGVENIRPYTITAEDLQE